jgi:hypothetical protein
MLDTMWLDASYRGDASYKAKSDSNELQTKWLSKRYLLSGCKIRKGERLYGTYVWYLPPIATHGSPEIGNSPDGKSPPEVESDEQRGAHDRKEDSITQGNAPEEDKSDDR